MRKVIVTMWVSLDGFIAGPNDEMDWIGGLYNEEMGKYETDLVRAGDTLLLGRKTYESFAGAWPKVPENPAASAGEVEYANIVNAMHKVVVSRTLETAEWNDSRVVKGNLAEEVAKLKQEPGKDVIIYGSASIVQALTNFDLVDEYQLLVHPIVLGSGKPLFKDITGSHKLKLITAKTFDSGVVVLYYEPAQK
ncbi:MAG TPA: dihydrofolate reductase family protein [Ktedonobacteraceae bacterium]|nr:dihydrofolate reductase family protein [Ktedonobacteraceae bacterium]